jgi:hypothetical protein
MKSKKKVSRRRYRVTRSKQRRHRGGKGDSHIENVKYLEQKKEEENNNHRDIIAQLQHLQLNKQ